MKNLPRTIDRLREDERMTITYQNESYSVWCYVEFKNGDKSYSVTKIREFGLGMSMNISKITNNYIYLYNYDMMHSRTQYRMKIENITITKK